MRHGSHDVSLLDHGPDFIGSAFEGEGIEAANGANYRRLIEIKSLWDPENRFRVNKNVAREGARG